MKRLLIIIFLLINLIIVARLAFLGVYKKNYYNQIVAENTNRVIEGMTAPRGRILDVNGNILVDNIGVKRPGTGISPMKWDEVIGKVSHQDFSEDELITIV